MSGPDEQEMKILPGFRAKVADLNLDDDSDMFLIRWIRAREYNLVEAESMLRKHMEWRKEVDFDNICRWEPPVEITSEYPVDIIGFDEDNCPVGIVPFGRWDVKFAVDHGLRIEFVRFIDQMYIKVLHLMKGKKTRENVPVTQFVIVYDMDGLSMRTLTCYAALDMMMETLKRFEMNHPETLKRCYVVNASRAFSILFAIVKPILAQRTFGKVEVYSNASKWKPVLVKAISPDILPSSLGGSNVNSIVSTFRVKKRGTSQKDHLQQDDHDDSLCVTIGAGEKLPIELQILESNTTISWSFNVENHDLGFSLLYEDKEELVKYSRVQTPNKHEGSLICHRPGKYTFSFDNSYSRLRPKILHYKVVIEPEGQVKEELERGIA